MKGLNYIIAIIIFTLTISGFSQETKMVKNQKKRLEKQEVEKNKAANTAVKEGKKRHLNIQTKKTKKRMKKKLKKSKALNKKRSGKKKSFFGRIFTGKG